MLLVGEKIKGKGSAIAFGNLSRSSISCRHLLGAVCCSLHLYGLCQGDFRVMFTKMCELLIYHKVKSFGFFIYTNLFFAWITFSCVLTAHLAYWSLSTSRTSACYCSTSDDWLQVFVHWFLKRNWCLSKWPQWSLGPWWFTSGIYYKQQLESLGFHKAWI